MEVCTRVSRVVRCVPHVRVWVTVHGEGVLGWPHPLHTLVLPAPGTSLSVAVHPLLWTRRRGRCGWRSCIPTWVSVRALRACRVATRPPVSDEAAPAPDAAPALGLRPQLSLACSCTLSAFLQLISASQLMPPRHAGALMPSGGAERLIVDFVLELQEAGHHVDVYTAHHDPKRCFEETAPGTTRVSCGGQGEVAR